MSLSNEEYQIFNTIVENIDNPAQKEQKTVTYKVLVYILVFFVGMATMIGSVIIKQPIIGVISFGIMVYGANGVYGLSRYARLNEFIE